MRKKIHDQLPLAQPYIAHVHAKELEAMDQILSEMSSVLDTIQRELVRGRSSRLGREGMTAEQSSGASSSSSSTGTPTRS